MQDSDKLLVLKIVIAYLRKQNGRRHKVYVNIPEHLLTYDETSGNYTANLKTFIETL